ncbi:ice-binding family protein [Flavobacterium ardleyense]|uniref:ice-binding family protein n=1 Tax=Flavobacterium ardleyense TaxID=2038737 RepID=UPI00298CE988|nr:ice-binding family protein [Flavobacterium ardleyense]
MKNNLLLLITISFCLFSSNTIFSQTLNLNSLANFDLFTSDGAITNTGLTQVSGNIGTNLGAISGFSASPSSINIQNVATAQAVIDLSALYEELLVTTPTVLNHPLTFGTGEALSPGIYDVNGAISIAGTLTLDGQGNSNALFIIKTNGALNAAAYAKIVLINGARADNVYWLAAGAAGFATFADIKGIVVSNAAIVFGAYAKLDGKALTKFGAITTLNSYINIQFPAANETANLGSASKFVMYTAAGTISNSGISTYTGLIGTDAGAISSFPVGTENLINQNDITAACKVDLFSAYADLQGRTPTNTAHAVAYGSETLTPGIYKNIAAITTAGILTLDGQGDPNSIFIFQFGAALAIGANTEIILSNGAHASNVFWIVEGAVSIGASTKVEGTFISNAALALGANCSLNGRILILAGAITTLDGMTLKIPEARIFPINQAIDYGSFPANLFLAGSTKIIINWQKSTDSSFSNPTNISNATPSLGGSEMGVIVDDTWFRARFQDNTYSASTKMTVGDKTTLINGQWDNGFPDNTKTAVFQSIFTSTENFIARSVVVESNTSVIISSGNNVILNGSITIKDGASFTLSNNSNLIQLTNAINIGKINVLKNSSKLKRLDYTLWSSPVKDQKLLSYSPFTNLTRFYNYNSNTDQYNAVAAPNSTNFNIATGYLIRMPNDHPTVATVWNGSFHGIPNNGDINYNIENLEIGKPFYLVGNPYPSKLDAKKFVDDNSDFITGSLYFWRKTNDANKPSYCTWTTAGFTTNGEDEAEDLDNFISSSQGFFVEVLPNSKEIIFKNSQRSDNTIEQFFKTQNIVEKNRIWLNATSLNGAYSQMLLGYITNATLAVDHGIDGKYKNDGVIALTSTIDGAPYTIQGRPLPFEASDIVSLQFMATEAGQYTIAIDHVDGLFESNQVIYLKDQFTGLLHNLKTQSYTFTSEAGTFESRFTIVYQNPLSTNEFTEENNSIIVYQKNNEVVISSTKSSLKSIEIFDTLGRLVQEYSNINLNEVKIPARNGKQLLLLQITDENNQITIKKLID